MKALLTSLLLLLACAARGQSNLVELKLWLEMPKFTNDGAVINYYVTNLTVVTNVYYIVTNIYIWNGTNSTVTQMPNDIIDTRLGPRMIRYLSKPAFFTFDNFGKDSVTTLYWVNPGNLLMTWPTNIIWLGPMPTNEFRGAVLFESVNGGEIWGTR